MIWNLSANSTKMILIRNSCALNFRLSLCTFSRYKKDVKSYFLSLSLAELSLISNVKYLMQLILVMPATNASSERSFSALRRVSSGNHETGSSKLHYASSCTQGQTDKLDLKLLVNEFINSDHRSNIFAKLTIKK